MSKLVSPEKPFDISKQEVWEAFRQVKANNGSPGVDALTLGEFEADLRGNLFKIWNRMSSGSYFPPPVQAVPIPKQGGGTRMLGVPTVADRIAQTVVANRIVTKVEPIFHPDSYGYRPGRSALDAVETARHRCWRNDWVIDLDIQAFFDSVPWDLVEKAVARHCPEPWVLLYVKRWLRAPLQQCDGSLTTRDRGTREVHVRIRGSRGLQCPRRPDSIDPGLVLPGIRLRTRSVQWVVHRVLASLTEWRRRSDGPAGTSASSPPAASRPSSTPAATH